MRTGGGWAYGESVVVGIGEGRGRGEGVRRTFICRDEHEMR